MTSVLVLGGDGMLGSTVSACLKASPQLRVISTSRKADAVDGFAVSAGGSGLESLIRDRGPFQYAINCIGVLSSEISVDRPESVLAAVRANALFPHELASIAMTHGIRVLHVSTDGVFSGRSPDPYVETDRCDCDDVYGRTKVIGEAVQVNVLNFRCSVVGLSPQRRRGLLEWFLSRPRGSAVAGYTNHHWNGVTTLQFARLCLEIIAGNVFDGLRSRAPTHHFCPNRPISKYDLLMIFRNVFEHDITISAECAPTPVSRVLGTIYDGLSELPGSATSLQEAVQQLAADARQAERPGAPIPQSSRRM